MIHIKCPLCEHHEARDKLLAMPPCYKCNTKMVMDEEFTQEDPDFPGYVFDIDDSGDEDSGT